MSMDREVPKAAAVGLGSVTLSTGLDGGAILEPVRYQLRSFTGATLIELVRRDDRGEAANWAVVVTAFSGLVMNDRGDLEWEPMPSYRSEEFKRHTRFTFEEAVGLGLRWISEAEAELASFEPT